MLNLTIILFTYNNVNIRTFLVHFILFWMIFPKVNSYIALRNYAIVFTHVYTFN